MMVLIWLISFGCIITFIVLTSEKNSFKYFYCSSLTLIDKDLPFLSLPLPEYALHVLSGGTKDG